MQAAGRVPQLRHAKCAGIDHCVVAGLADTSAEILESFNIVRVLSVKEIDRYLLLRSWVSFQIYKVPNSIYKLLKENTPEVFVPVQVSNFTQIWFHNKYTPRQPTV